MSTEKFEASVQYDDLTGTAAADRADFGDAIDWLKKRDLIADEEFLVGIKAYVSTSTIEQDESSMVDVTFLICNASSFDDVVVSIRSGNIVVKKINKEMSFMEFFSLFKRFSITLSGKGELEGRDYVEL